MVSVIQIKPLKLLSNLMNKNTLISFKKQIELLLSNKGCYPYYSLQFCYENIVYLLNSFTRRKYVFAQNLQCMKGGQVVE